jgi:exportin-2 (importin alpha re-exporter)
MEHFEADVTQIIKGYISTFLQVRSKASCTEVVDSQEYQSDPSGKWKSKDTAIYLLTSIASKGSTQQVSLCGLRMAADSQLGVTSTNQLVDIVEFFGQNVYSDLQAAPGSVHPILIVDAIKFLYTFRSQAGSSLSA